jgi:ELWxxDGT repeat protein
MVRDISPGPASSSPAHLASYGGALFFSADDGVRGRELWKSDGTEPGTFLVRDLTPGSGSTSFQSQLIVANGLLFFLVERERPTLSLRRTELWRTDGSQAGTFVVHDASYSFFYDIQMGSRDGTNGLDLWRSGDFDGDGRADNLWRKVGPGLDTGAPYIWPMIGPDVSAGTYLDPTGADWKVVGAADLNGDGRSDILWRNMNPSALDAGFLYVWLMDGARPIAGTGYTNSQANFTWDVENPR